MKCFARQGVKLTIRKEGRPNHRGGRYGEDDDDEDEDVDE
jgi:hypothetical protein